MTKLIDQLKLVFLGVFAIACVAVWGYQWFVVGPQHRCEQAGNWWDPQSRQCGIVVDVRSFPRIAPAPHSRRPATVPAAAAGSPAIPMSGPATADAAAPPAR
jgi:hypothetical protein